MTIPYDTVLKKGQIRLLRVLSQEDDGPDRSVVICTQKIVDLADEPEYYALSYTWGLPYKYVIWEKDHEMQLTEDWSPADVPPNYKFVVDGKELWMTPNMFFCLSAFADVAVTSWVWIDAICIRQHDEVEKAMQVQAMKDVYASAVAVLISLGADDFVLPHGSMEDVLEVVECFVPKLQKAIADDSELLHTLELGALADASFEAKVGIENLAKKLMAFAEFCTIFRWFNRLWCIQEVVLAQAVAVRCGKRNVSWNAMEELVRVLQDYSWDRWLGLCITKNTGYGESQLAWCGALVSMCTLRSIVHALDTTSAAYRRLRLRGMSEIGNLLRDESDAAWIQGSSPVSHRLKKPTQTDPFAFSLCASVLTCAQSAGCSNDLDRVYGFLGIFDALLAEDVSTLVNVSYTVSVSDLYLKVMVLLMQKSESLDLVTSQFPEFRHQQQQSSWVFDLRRPFTRSGVIAMEGECASCGMKAICESRLGQVPAFQVCDNELYVFGGELDRISHVLDLTFADGTRVLNVLEGLADILPSKITKRPRLELIWRTLIQNRWAILEGLQKADLNVENSFLLYILLEAVSEMAIQDKQSKVDSAVLENHVRRFVGILSSFHLADESDELDIGSYVDLLRLYLDYTCKMNDLDRESHRIRQQESKRLARLNDNAVRPPIDPEPALSNTQTESGDNLPPQLVQLTAPFIRSMMGGMSPNRVLFVSERGLIGSAPNSTQIGDSIWIVYGASTPWLLRSAREDRLHMPGMWPDDKTDGDGRHDEERYSFVGDTFILDMMNGEALHREEFGLNERARRVIIV